MMIRTVLSATLCLIFLATSGCTDRGPAGQTTAARTSTPTPPAPQSSVRLKHGQPPLTYMLASGGKVRVVDATLKKDLVRAQAQTHTLITIDARHGIMLGDKLIHQGPLPDDHEYQLWLDR